MGVDRTLGIAWRVMVREERRTREETADVHYVCGVQPEGRRKGSRSLGQCGNGQLGGVLGVAGHFKEHVESGGRCRQTWMGLRGRLGSALVEHMKVRSKTPWELGDSRFRIRGLITAKL